jgi:chromosome segregation protein
MKSLSRVILINWYLFEQEQWDIRGHVALLGKNGSGKSSFLDALQLVLLGGNKQDWNPNAKASESSGDRNIRGYALGLVKDESAIGNSTQYQPREDALTRIVLVFEDHETGECCSIGTAITASRSDPQEHFEGFFILQGQALELSDLIDEQAEASYALPYDRLKALFLSNSKMGLESNEQDRDVYFFDHEPKKFVEQMLRSLGDSRHPPSPEKFVRAFKQSIKLSGITGSVSDFVKQSILDSSPINLSMMRAQIESLNNKKKAVQVAKEQQAILEEIDKDLNRAVEAGKRHIALQWCAAELNFYANDAHINDLAEELTALASKLSTTKQELAGTKKSLKQARDEQLELTGLINSDNSQSKKTQLSQERDNHIEAENRILTTIRNILDAIRGGAEVLKYKNHVDPTLTQEITQVIQTIEEAGTLWRDEVSVIESSVSRISTTMPAAIKTLETRRDILLLERNETREQLERIQAQLDRLNAGKSNLHSDTIALIEVLAEHGIPATPVCELVEVTDTHWQPAIEAYLKKNTEALVVNQDYSQKAIDIYRRLKRHKHLQAIIVDGHKASRLRIDRVEGTAAALIRGEDTIAVNFVQNLLSGIELHEDTKSILKAKRALGADGSFQSSAAFTKLKLPEFPILGRGAREGQISYLNTQSTRWTHTLVEQDKQFYSSEKTIKALNAYLVRLDGNRGLQQWVNELGETEDHIRSLNDKIDAIDTSHLGQYVERKNQLEKQITEWDNRKDDLIGNRSTMRSEFKQKNGERTRLRGIDKSLSEARQKWTEHRSFDPQLADKLYAELEEEYPLDTLASYEEAIKRCHEKKELADATRRSKEEKGKLAFAEYVARYPDNILAGTPASLEGYASEVALRLRNIIEIGLPEREGEVNDAFYKLTHAIRTDLAIKLRGQISEMKRRFTELNKELNDRPFSANQKYRFHYARLDEYQDFLQFVENVDSETVANVDSLFDESIYINDVIQTILDDNNGDQLGDYRNYYSFDILIKDTESGIEEMFSRTKGKDSGGEYMTPFYVAMGASMAGAYRFETRDDGKVESGIALFPSDEAFKNMDYANTNQAAEYLKSIGLQLFVAAPDSAEPEFRTFADTVLFFIREGSTATISVDYVTPWAQGIIKDSFHGRVN